MNTVLINIRGMFWLSLLASILIISFPLHAEERSPENNAQVIQAFTPKDAVQPGVISIEDKTKQIVMFMMGVPLLILLLATGALGIAMGVYGKQVFVAHMICAGLSMTLAVAHAIVGLVWFYPF